MSDRGSRMMAALFLAWVIGYFMHWLSRYDWARPAIGVVSIVLLLWVYVGLTRPKEPPAS